MSRSDYLDPVRGQTTLVVPETEFESLVSAGLFEGVNLNSSQILNMQSSAADANRLGTLGIVFDSPQAGSLQPYVEDHVLIAVVRDPFIVAGTTTLQATDFYFVVGRIRSSNSIQLTWMSVSPMFASIQVNGDVAGAPCACNNSKPECIQFPPEDGGGCPGPDYDCGGGSPYWLQVALADFPGGTSVATNACTQLPQYLRGNGKPLIGAVGGFELEQFLIGVPPVPLPKKFCQTCLPIDCTLDMTNNPKDYTSMPPPRSICVGIPIQTSRDCEAGACYGDTSEAGASSDLSALGACFGASGGGALSSPTMPHQPDEIPACKISVPDVCAVVDYDDEFSGKYCDSQTRNFLIQTAMTCDGSSALGTSNSPGYTCCEGVANCACIDVGNMKLCTDCSSGACVQSAYGSVVDPRVAFPPGYVPICDGTTASTNCSSATPATPPADDTQNQASDDTEKARQAAKAAQEKAEADAAAAALTTETPNVQPIETENAATTPLVPQGKPEQVSGKNSNVGGADKDAEETTADPVLLASGALLMQPTDIHVEGQQFDLMFQRTYVSTSMGRGQLGSNWTHNWEARLEPLLPSTAPDWAPPFCTQVYPTITCLFYRDGFGNSSLLVWDTVTHRFAPQNGNDSSVIPIRGGGYLLATAEGATRRFNRDGYLTSDRDRFGNGFKIELTRTPLFAVFQRYCTRLSDENQAGDSRPSSRDLEATSSMKFGQMCQHLANIFDDQEMEPLTVEGWERGGLLPPYEISLDIDAI